MSTEDGLRDLAGYGGPAQVIFMDQVFALTPDTLVPLLRFAGSSPPEDADDNGVQNHALATMYRLLEETIADFPRFTETAIAAKATISDITPVVQHVIEFWCARGHWPARRLLATIAVNLEEFDGGSLQRTGRGLAGLSPREACNLAMAICLDGRGEEDRATFLEDLEYEGNPEAEAMALVRQMKAAQAQAAAQEPEAAAGDGPHRLGSEGA